MLAAMRQAHILTEVRRTGGVRIADLTAVLGVSDMTIRRDLDTLHRRGLLSKVHGGATAVDTASAIEPEFSTKSLREPVEKAVIAAAAAELVSPGMAIALSAGTTTWALAKLLTGMADLTVVTNSLKVAEVLDAQQRPDLTVVLTGGRPTPSGGLVGPIAVQAWRALHVDVAFMGVHGIDEHAGLTTPNMLEAETNGAMVASARQLVVLADHTKWGAVGLAQICPLSSISTLIVDDRFDREAMGIVQQHVGELTVARSSGSRHSRDDR